MAFVNGITSKGHWNEYSVTDIEENTFHKPTVNDRNAGDIFCSYLFQIIPFTVHK
jgi:hypothetical protein